MRGPYNSALVMAGEPVHGLGMMMRQSLEVAKIRVPSKRLKTLDQDKVLALAEDILENGQLTPIRVRKDGDGYILVEGMHRLHAMIALGEEAVEGYLVKARLH